jgi:hypothetical protein
MSCRPAQLRTGDRLMLVDGLGRSETLIEFIRREPARGKGCPATNWIRSHEWRGANGPDDDGTCTISDYELSRRARLI